MIVDEELDDAFRAIGRYVVEFSQLLREMREMVAWYVAGGLVDSDIPNMLLGEATAQVISNAFFGMCRMASELDEKEKKVASTLRNELTKAIEARNDIAHGDWWVGMWEFRNARPGGKLETPKRLDPRLVRTLPARSEGPQKVLSLSTADLDAMTNRLLELTTLIVEYGKLALQLPVHGLRENDESYPSVKEFRVRDVLVVTGGGRGKNSTPARVVREGPLAARVYKSEFAWPYRSSIPRSDSQ